MSNVITNVVYFSKNYRKEGCMNTFKSLFGIRLKMLRKAKGISQENFAEMININPRNLSRIETGQTFPTSENIEKIIKALECSSTALFNFDEFIDIEKKREELTNYILQSQNDKITLMYKFMKTIE